MHGDKSHNFVNLPDAAINAVRILTTTMNDSYFMVIICYAYVSASTLYHLWKLLLAIPHYGEILK